ncbi:hypothetical protein L596_026998 [Steinernema carpocapsae]|uniref:Uncharacterized protein n=1 Tax=Steinernema carpocapsae TaxID=34508 RepID=A0A4U5M304_STECR|nr:hypothetical protein L596_026998 [Steinernema carpocapsae]
MREYMTIQKAYKYDQRSGLNHRKAKPRKRLITIYPHTTELLRCLHVSMARRTRAIRASSLVRRPVEYLLMAPEFFVMNFVLCAVAVAQVP